MTKPPKTSRSLADNLASILVLGLFLALFISIAVPNYVGHGRGRLNAITFNLRQLDAAVQQWEIDHHPTGAVLVAREDIAPYLRFAPDHWVKRVAGEQYVLKPLPQSPEAVLTREVEGHPKGTIIRFGTNGGGLQFILPNTQGGASGTPPVHSRTNRTSGVAATSRHRP